ncbi:STAS domain-containing protein [Actinoplanes sp. N902-109]|uniref:STAS domain-containing protein n=1 Tax=Actinoplanes sp. (strain N902-109) TaxID=649831 RepID=UPI00032941B1|nr:STAS domain-containing protein [Actinoplanes sp. N902-109]AGL20804.1 anti-anti-sigma factor [Actinoplanes sp. N902-109]
MAFDCTIERQDDRLVVVPEGDIDVASAAAMRQVLQQIMDRREYHHIDVDMRAVTFLDSSGLGMFVAAHRAATARGVALRLIEPGPVVRMVLEVTNLNEVLTGTTAQPS